MRQLIRPLSPCAGLYHDLETGLAWVEDGDAVHLCHPQVEPGQVVEEDQVMELDGVRYNVSLLRVTVELEELARQHCQCGGQHTLWGQRSPERENY